MTSASLSCPEGLHLHEIRTLPTHKSRQGRIPCAKFGMPSSICFVTAGRGVCFAGFSVWEDDKSRAFFPHTDRGSGRVAASGRCAGRRRAHPTANDATRAPPSAPSHHPNPNAIHYPPHTNAPRLLSFPTQAAKPLPGVFPKQNKVAARRRGLSPPWLWKANPTIRRT